MTGRYLDDYAVGQSCISGRHRIDEVQIHRFAAEFAPQPFHLDGQAAKDTLFGGLASSGWHTAALTMRLTLASDVVPEGGIIGAGFDELSWRPGDERHLRIEILNVRPSRLKPDRGMIKLRTVTLNQNSQPVQISVGNLVVLRRPRDLNDGNIRPPTMRDAPGRRTEMER